MRVAPVLALAALGLSLQMAPYRLAGSDAGAMLTAASRILDGGVFYRDVDSYPFPGAAYLLAGAMAVFGETVAVSRSLAAALFAATVLSLYAVALRLLGPGRAALFGASLLAFKLLAWPSFTAYTYWDVAFAFGCAACAAFSAHRPGRASGSLAAAGLLCGLAVTAKQSLGLPLAAAALLVLALRGGPGRLRAGLNSGLKEALAFALPAALPFAALCAFFGSQGLLSEMLESGLLRPFSAYLPASSTSFLEPLFWWRFGELRELAGLAYSSEPLWSMLTRRELPAEHLLWTLCELASRLVYTSVPIAFGIAFWRLAARRREPATQALLAFAPLAAGIFASAFPRADWSHVISVYPVVLLLCFALRAPRARPALGELASVAAVLALCLALTFVQQRGLTHAMELERAELRVEPDKAWVESAVRFVADEIPPGEPFFVYGHEAFFYFLADRHSPWRFSQLYPGQGGRGRGEEVVAALAATPPRLVLQGALRFPRTTPIAEDLPALERWIREHYVADPRVFERYPPEGPLPRARQFQMLRLRGAGGASPSAR